MSGILKIQVGAICHYREIKQASFEKKIVAKGMLCVSNHSSLARACFLALDKGLCSSHALEELTSVHSSFGETDKIVNMQGDKYINQSACC